MYLTIVAGCGRSRNQSNIAEQEYFRRRTRKKNNSFGGIVSTMGSLHYAKSRQTGTLAHLLGASNIKAHPIDGWQLATTLFSKSSMPYVKQPEQELFRTPTLLFLIVVFS
ncbi:Uncharacterized protein HZ326_26521 [Fusarium oxysporum f. sp. albedinis]|nr:Uncharacterized protein HZ326_26521 [Fusarium oxysporum f. sp. albedinis]